MLPEPASSGVGHRSESAKQCHPGQFWLGMGTLRRIIAAGAAPSRTGSGSNQLGDRWFLLRGRQRTRFSSRSPPRPDPDVNLNFDTQPSFRKFSRCDL
jgi:hypothetical protein